MNNKVGNATWNNTFEKQRGTTHERSNEYASVNCETQENEEEEEAKDKSKSKKNG